MQLMWSASRKGKIKALGSGVAKSALTSHSWCKLEPKIRSFKRYKDVISDKMSDVVGKM